MLNDHTAPGLKESFHERNVMQNRHNLRNSEYDLTIPKRRTEYLRGSFRYRGAMLWNDLLFATKSASNLDSFDGEQPRPRRFDVLRGRAKRVGTSPEVNPN